MICVLFSRPSHDLTLSYLFYYSKELVKLSEELNYKTINKEKEEANKVIITNLIKKQNPNLIMFNGHGGDDFVCGHKNEIIVSSKENSEILANSVTYSLSCSSASILGREAVKKGAKCFIGYEFDFAFGKDPDSEAVPRRDKIAKLFLEPSNILFKSILNGKTVRDSIIKAKLKMKENIWYLSTTDSFPEASYYAPFLFGNYSGLIALGDELVSIKCLSI